MVNEGLRPFHGRAQRPVMATSIDLAYAGVMAKPEPSIFDVIDTAHEARRDAEAEADIEAGRVIPNDEVCAWLETWGTPNEKPVPKAWFKS